MVNVQDTNIHCIHYKVQLWRNESEQNRENYTTQALLQSQESIITAVLICSAQSVQPAPSL